MGDALERFEPPADQGPPNPVDLKIVSPESPFLATETSVEPNIDFILHVAEVNYKDPATVLLRTCETLGLIEPSDRIAELSKSVSALNLRKDLSDQEKAQLEADKHRVNTHLRFMSLLRLGNELYKRLFGSPGVVDTDEVMRLLEETEAYDHTPVLEALSRAAAEVPPPALVNRSKDVSDNLRHTDRLARIIILAEVNQANDV